MIFLHTQQIFCAAISAGLRQHKTTHDTLRIRKTMEELAANRQVSTEGIGKTERTILFKLVSLYTGAEESQGMAKKEAARDFEIGVRRSLARSEPTPIGRCGFGQS